MFSEGSVCKLEICHAIAEARISDGAFFSEYDLKRCVPAIRRTGGGRYFNSEYRKGQSLLLGIALSIPEAHSGCLADILAQTSRE